MDEFNNKVVVTFKDGSEMFFRVNADEIKETEDKDTIILNLKADISSKDNDIKMLRFIIDTLAKKDNLNNECYEWFEEMKPYIYGK